MRRLRIAAPLQLSLTLSLSEVPRGPQVWALLPDAARQQVLVLLARLIARGVIAGDDPQEPTR
jgi:hypothetical protein